MNVRSMLKEVLPDFLVNLIRRGLYPIRRLIFFCRSLKSIAKAKLISHQGGTIRLELGSARRRPGFYTVDLGAGADLVLDLRNGIPFPDNSIDLIYTSHLLEHFDYNEMIKLLRDVYRVLKPGGEFKIVVPDASLFVRGYMDPMRFDAEKYIQEPNFKVYGAIDYVNYIAYMGGAHRFMFDSENLLNILHSAGFVQAQVREFDPVMDLEIRKHQSIHAVAYKP